jgi:sulfur relay (sulfurtransferase) complex TusBCD TusD component (DsrE family)
MKDSIVILVNDDGMGKAGQELQHKLMGIYLGLIDQNSLLPSAICFYADGVKLVVEGSPVLDRLQTLESNGVRLVVCRTCLEYYGLLEKVRVGIVGGMTDILEAQWKARKVITL